VTDEVPSGYWYDGQYVAPRGIRVLNAMRAYRAAELGMRKRTRSTMRMGDTDLHALRLLLRAQRVGDSLSPKDLAQSLEISSASTTILVDRLEKSGHVVRVRHPRDRRAIILETTDATERDVRQTLGQMHERMAAVAATLSEADAATVVAFLDALRVSLDAPLDLTREAR
jgi:DNA-binding MarR family transcriptional regulator